MPAKVKVKVLSGRNLPVMDKGSDTTDAYVELKLGSVTHKTDVCRKSLNPQWSCNEWYRFEVDDADLQDEPLQLRLMDHDTYSANDAIGKVYISLNPLLLPLTHHSHTEAHTGKGATMSGWIPVFDTMHGIRGEVNVIVKVELFNDFNKFRQSSCGMQFFHSPIVPQGYQVQTIHGFVEELVVNDDPEYQWIDKIRTPRASNEARQVAFLKLSGQVQRKIGLKALELGANAVIGFKRCLDLEGEVGVVARGAGTAVTLIKLLDHQSAVSPSMLASHVTNSPDNIQHQLKQYIDFINLENKSTVINSLSSPEPSSDNSNMFPSIGLLDEESVGETNVRNLLQQEDMRGYSPKKTLKSSIQNLKGSSQSGKKRRDGRKRNDFVDDDNADRASIASYTSERSIKFSFSDIKSEIKRKTILRQPILKKSSSGGDGNQMAALLVRSVIRAHSSLDCIKESLESNSPMSTLRRSSKAQGNSDGEIMTSEPSIVVDSSQIMAEPNFEEKQKQYASMTNINLDSSGAINIREFLPVRVAESCPTTPDDSFLTLPKEPGYLASSVSSVGGSSEEFSSSDDGEDNSEENSDIAKIADADLDTVSLVVKSVMEHQVDSNVISHMEEKLQSISPTLSDKVSIVEENWAPSYDVELDEISKIETVQNDRESVIMESSNSIDEPAVASEPVESKGSRGFHFHFPKKLFRRHTSASGAPPKVDVVRKLSRLSLNSLRPKIGRKEPEEPSLIATAIKTILLEKVNIMGEIIQRGPIVGDETHISRSVSQHDLFRPHDLKSIDSSGSENDISDRREERKIETVLGSPFVSYDEIRFTSDPDLHLIHTPTLSETFSLNSLKSVDNHLPKRTSSKNWYPSKNTDYINIEQRVDKGVSESSSKRSEALTFEEDDPKSAKVSVERVEEEKLKDNSLRNSKFDIENTATVYSKSTKKSKSELHLDSGFVRPKAHIRGGSLTAGVCGPSVLRPSMNQDNLDLLEYPFLTIVKFPPGFVSHIGGAVAARSVKLLERVPNPEEPAPRDAWWSELRTEVRSHMRALRCNAVLAYQETTTICDDICVLSATGTAAVIDLRLSNAPYNVYNVEQNITPKAHDSEVNDKRAELVQTSSLDRTDFEKTDILNANNYTRNTTDSHAINRNKRMSERCGPCHLPYNTGSVPFRVSVTKCAVCKKGRVPSVLLCSIEPIDGLSIVGRGCLIQAVASKARVPVRGEPAARDISDQLPFLEYELHRLLLAKLRVRGMNAVFGLKTTIAVGATVVAAVGVGTGVLLAALGPCTVGPKLRAAPGDNKVRALQKGLDDALHANKNVYHLHIEPDAFNKIQGSDTEESEEELPDVELGAGNKDTCVLEVDDAEDLEVLRMLNEARPPAGLHVVNTQSVPGLPACENLGSVAHLQMFTQLWRARLSSPTLLYPHFHRLLQNVYFKLRRMVPCAVCDLKFRLDLPEADEIQLVVTGMALGITELTHEKSDAKKDHDHIKKSDSNEMIFTLDEETAVDLNPQTRNVKHAAKPESPVQNPTSNTNPPFQLEWRPTVVMTPLAVVPGGRMLEYLGNLDFIFVRESTSVREQGGLSGFLHIFVTEVLAVVRAHVTALGGNAIVAFYMTELILSDNPHKNQAQCLVSVGGDVVFVSYLNNE